MNFLKITLLSTLALSFGAEASVRILPQKGEKLTFDRTYTKQILADRTLQRVKKTTFTLSNSGGHLIGTWTATFRDLRTDKEIEGQATGLCHRVSARRIECVTSTDAGTMEIIAEKDHVLLNIPLGQGVQFAKKEEIGKPRKAPEPKTETAYDLMDGSESGESPEEEEQPWSENLLGDDADNSRFKAYPKRARR